MTADVLYALWRRDVVKFLRDRQSVIGAVARPLLWLLAFGFGLRGSFRGAGSTDYVTFLVPGLAAMTVLFSSMFQSISIVWDREFGFLKELLVAPVPRGAIIAGKMLAGSTIALVEALLVLVLSFVLGVHLSWLGVLLGLGVLALFGMAVTGLGVAIASRLKTFEGFGAIVNFVIQPLFFLSGALYPTDKLPLALKVVVRANPMSYAVDAVRGLTVGVHDLPVLFDTAMVALSALLLGALAALLFARMES